MAELRKDLPGLDEVHILHALYDAGDRADLTILVRGFGTRVEDANGRRYLDGMSGVWNTHLGYGRQELVEAAAEQMRELAFGSTYSGFTNVPAIQLAARLQAVTAQRLQATFFTASGADANEAAFKTARYYWRRRGKPEKTKILSLEHGFHGLTLAAMSATGIPAFSHMFQPVVPHFVRVPGPYPYRCDFAGPGETPAEAAVRRLDEAIRREEARTVAAFIVEPVQGPGGG